MDAGLAFVLAGTVGAGISGAELAQRHHHRVFSDIFWNHWFLILASVNFCAAGAISWFLPSLLPNGVQLTEPLWLGLASGLAYQAILRLSLFDIEVRGRIIGIGFDYFYNSVSNFILRQHARHIEKSIDAGFGELYLSLKENEVAIFYGAAVQAVEGCTDPDLIEDFREALALALKEARPERRICFHLFVLMLDICGDQREVKRRITDFQKDSKGVLQANIKLREQFPNLLS